MMRAPLQLERYFFTHVHVEATPEYGDAQQDQPEQRRVNVSAKLQFMRHEQDPHRYQLTLAIEKVSASQGLLPYELEAQVVGFFSVDPEFEHENIDKLVQVNGASMLYTAVREHLLMITGRGPWGEFQLPTVNFHDAVSAQEHQTTHAEDAE